MNAIDPSLIIIPDTNVQHTTPTTPSLPATVYDGTLSSLTPQNVLQSMHMSLHEDHPGCPTSLDCLPYTATKPQYTLPVLLRAAILGSTHQRLTLREIYDAIAQRFPYFRTATENWKGSIRHALSLKDMFKHVPRQDIEPGVGNFWTVNANAPQNKRIIAHLKRARARIAPATHSPSPDSNDVSEDDIQGASSSSRRLKDSGDSTPTPVNSRMPRPSRRVTLRAAVANRCDYDKLAEEIHDSVLDEEGSNEDERTHSSKTRGKRKGKVKPGVGARPITTRKRSKSLTDEETICLLLKELGELRQQICAANAETMHLTNQLTDLHADNAHFRAAINQVGQRIQQEQSMRWAVEDKLNGLHHQGDWRKTMDVECYGGREDEFWD